MPAADAFFVDTNVLLYAVDPVNRTKREQALEWLDRMWSEGAGRVSWQVLHEFYWNAVHKMKLDPESAREMVEELSNWMPVGASLGLVQRAWHWIDVAQLAYWDALVVAAAERSGARFLLSEDFQSGRAYGDIQILNPFLARSNP